LEHVEDITKYTDSLEEINDNNLYALNLEMGYDTGIHLDYENKHITVNGKREPIKKFIDIDPENSTVISKEEKEKFIDMNDETSRVEVPEQEEEQNNQYTLIEPDCDSDYTADDVKEGVVAGQIDSSLELNNELNAQRLGNPGDSKFASRISGQPNFKWQ
jgi:hypothetical protein